MRTRWWKWITGVESLWVIAIPVLERFSSSWCKQYLPHAPCPKATHCYFLPQLNRLSASIQWDKINMNHVSSGKYLAIPLIKRNEYTNTKGKNYCLWIGKKTVVKSTNEWHPNAWQVFPHKSWESFIKKRF